MEYLAAPASHGSPLENLISGRRNQRQRSGPFSSQWLNPDPATGLPLKVSGIVRVSTKLVTTWPKVVVVSKKASIVGGSAPVTIVIVLLAEIALPSVET